MIDATHPDYDDKEDQWQRVRDCMDGEDAVKASGRKYLPQLSGTDSSDYEAYKTRAVFYNATSRTHDGLVGALFRKDPQVTVPTQLEPLLDDITLSGFDLPTFAKEIAGEVIGPGRCGVITDMPQTGERPYLRLYKAQDILNWAVQRIDGQVTLTLVVLRENFNVLKEDFGSAEVKQVRILALDETGFYLQRLFQKTFEGNREEWVQVGEDIFPAVRGKRLDYIPFQFFGPEKNAAKPEKPPLLDLADINLSHYRTSADLEHGAHFTALPTIWVSGNRADDEAPLRVGSGVAWLLEEGAQAGILEYRGQGLEALEKRLERKEAHMAVLGARLLEDQKAGVEAAATVTLRHSGQNSVLAAIANGISAGLTRSLQWMAEFIGTTDAEIDVQINRDFMGEPMTSQEVVDLVQAWQSGAIGSKVLYHNLQKGERLPDDMTFDDWQEDKDQNDTGATFMGSGDESANIR